MVSMAFEIGLSERNIGTVAVQRVGGGERRVEDVVGLLTIPCQSSMHCRLSPQAGVGCPRSFMKAGGLSIGEECGCKRVYRKKEEVELNRSVSLP